MRQGVALGWLKPARLDSRVISVGNIQVGGAGKTPLVALIAREAHERGLRTCILCRGYGGEWESRGGLILPGDSKPHSGACGDEAALLHDLCPDAVIGVGADRVKQYEKAKTRTGTKFDLVILDDGFQHWKIKKDLEIVALTSARWGWKGSSGKVLFRDHPRMLRFADLLVWTKGDQPPVSFNKPMARVRYRIPGGSDSKPVWLVTGLGDGKSAETSIRDSGYDVARHLVFPDHAVYAEDTVKGILDAASRARCSVAITGKDWVKWRDLGISQERVRVLEPELVFVEGRELWSKTLWGT